MDGADLARLREAARALCSEFTGASWCDLDRERAFPEKLMAAAIAK
jgi:hypothetical protein